MIALEPLYNLTGLIIHKFISARHRNNIIYTLIRKRVCNALINSLCLWTIAAISISISGINKVKQSIHYFIHISE